MDTLGSGWDYALHSTGSHKTTTVLFRIRNDQTIEKGYNIFQMQRMRV